ncbi:MAG: CBS domain-containing protein [Planctomycetes bacterium]|nr:CBS domain-containing protein [Planctomycetota bacterium]|tara:strand:- start:90 stop:485 length:396 start_codon:yes stop_codon:yes gene_type:complete
MPTARDIMSKRFHTVKRDATVSDAVLLMNEHNCSSVIVAPQRELDTYGILTMRDVVYNVVAKGLRVHETRVHEVMTKPLIVAMPQMSIKHVARLMANCKVSRMPVIDGNELVGLVRLRDILTDLHLIDSLK